MPRISVDLENDIYDAFSLLCTKLRRKKADVIRELIFDWVTKAQRESWIHDIKYLRLKRFVLEAKKEAEEQKEER
jgi:hypothetical protein